MLAAASLSALLGCGASSSSGGETSVAPESGGSAAGGESAGAADASSPSSASSGGDTSGAGALFERGLAAYAAGDFGEAARLLSEADALVPSPELAYNLGRVYERMGETENAIAMFRRYLRDGSPSEADRADVDARIAGMEALAARHRDMLAVLPPSTDEVTAEARTFFERGVTMFRRRRYDAALTAFTAAYRFAPLPEVIYNLAVVSERTHHLQDAIDYYREYLRAVPNDPDRATLERTIADLRARLGGD